MCFHRKYSGDVEGSMSLLKFVEEAKSALLKLKQAE